MRLENKTAVITGASSGMGRDMVRLFVREGANVVAVARREGRLAELQDSLRDGPGRMEIYAGDVSRREVNEGMIDFALKTFCRLDVLVNNAGVTDDQSPIAQVTDETYERMMSINVYGPMCAMRKAVNVFLAQGGGGSIVNVASMGAKRPISGPIYCASKAAVTTMSQNVAYMYAPDRIRVNVLAPGAIKTEISAGLEFNPQGRERTGKLMAACTGLGEGMDVAYAALYFASDESSFISGAFLPVDNAWLAGG